MTSMIRLQSSDLKEFEVDLGVLALSKTLNTMIKDLGLADKENSMPIPLPNVDGATLEKVLEWCRQHKNDEIHETVNENTGKQCAIPKWDKEFLTVDQKVLFNLLTAANYLDIRGLLAYSAQTVANLIKGKEAEEIRTLFNIQNDFTPEEENQIRAENGWCL